MVMNIKTNRGGKFVVCVNAYVNMDESSDGIMNYNTHTPQVHFAENLGETTVDDAVVNHFVGVGVERIVASFNENIARYGDVPTRVTTTVDVREFGKFKVTLSVNGYKLNNNTRSITLSVLEVHQLADFIKSFVADCQLGDYFPNFAYAALHFICSVKDVDGNSLPLLAEFAS